MRSSLPSPVFLVVRFWSANAWGDGGTKRSAQINACLRETCPESEIHEIVLPLQLGWRNALLVLLQPRHWGGLFRLRKLNLRLAVRGVRDAKIIAGHMGELGDRIKAVVWEATMSPGVFLACDKPILGFPHNIEALNLAGRQLLGRKTPLPALVDEFSMLRKCSRLYFIAKEEAYLARLLGLSCGYLPYYPPADVCDKLEGIRLRRQSSTPGEVFLILGSASNAPTASALKKLLAGIKSRSDISHRQFIVCGNATENWAQECSTNVVVQGRVSEAELTRLFETCRAAIVFQEEGSGMLTRITELLLGGVPVVANQHAVRSVEMHVGLSIAADLNGVLDLVAQNEFPAVSGLVTPESTGLRAGKECLLEQLKKLVA